ncbi:MAG TPA: PLP-dependent aminotransferase family protein [Terracidiphilus sp.]|nr:PLP-dependent aminotransferase family protein [Terracidiphilus sp.]
MTYPSEGVSSIVTVDRKAGAPLHRQVYDGFRSAILLGKLKPGQLVPSSREFAADHVLSRFPVLQAYAQLLAEGYFESRAGSGTYVSSSLPERLMSASANRHSRLQGISGPRRLSRRSEQFPPVLLNRSNRIWGAFGVHQPAFDQFPFRIWSTLVAKHSRNPGAHVIHNVDPMGIRRFREAICDYLSSSRAVRCHPDQVMIVSGSQQALDITARVLLDPDDAVWVEEPGYRLGFSVFAAAGCRLIPVPVDRDGMNIDAGIALEPDAKAALVTPSHQYPLGSTMSATRRLQLLNWAQSSGAWIVEDDYDSEFRYESRPISSLQGMDANARVIYIGTFSKVLFPSVRIGYIVIPPDLVERFAAVRLAMDIFPPYLHQEVLADFMIEGHFGAHIRKMRQVYRERRSALIHCIEREFAGLLQVHGAEAGMHVAVTLPDGCSDTEIAARAAEERLSLYTISQYYQQSLALQGFVLGFGSTPVPEMKRAVEKLHAAIAAPQKERVLAATAD